MRSTTPNLPVEIQVVQAYALCWHKQNKQLIIAGFTSLFALMGLLLQKNERNSLLPFGVYTVVCFFIAAACMNVFGRIKLETLSDEINSGYKAQKSSSPIVRREFCFTGLRKLALFSSGAVEHYRNICLFVPYICYNLEKLFRGEVAASASLDSVILFTGLNFMTFFGSKAFSDWSSRRAFKKTWPFVDELARQLNRVSLDGDRARLNLSAQVLGPGHHRMVIGFAIFDHKSTRAQRIRSVELAKNCDLGVFAQKVFTLLKAKMSDKELILNRHPEEPELYLTFVAVPRAGLAADSLVQMIRECLQEALILSEYIVSLERSNPGALEEILKAQNPEQSQSTSNVLGLELNTAMREKIRQHFADRNAVLYQPMPNGAVANLPVQPPVRCLRIIEEAPSPSPAQSPSPPPVQKPRSPKSAQPSPRPSVFGAIEKPALPVNFGSYGSYCSDEAAHQESGQGYAKIRPLLFDSMPNEGRTRYYWTCKTDLVECLPEELRVASRRMGSGSNGVILTIRPKEELSEARPVFAKVKQFGQDERTVATKAVKVENPETKEAHVLLVFTERVRHADFREAKRTFDLETIVASGQSQAVSSAAARR